MHNRFWVRPKCKSALGTTSLVGIKFTAFPAACSNLGLLGLSFFMDPCILFERCSIVKFSVRTESWNFTLELTKPGGENATDWMFNVVPTIVAKPPPNECPVTAILHPFGRVSWMQWMYRIMFLWNSRSTFSTSNKKRKQEEKKKTTATSTFYYLQRIFGSVWTHW